MTNCDVTQIMLRALIGAREAIKDGCEMAFAEIERNGNFNPTTAKSVVAQICEQGTKRIAQNLTKDMGDTDPKHHKKYHRGIKNGTIGEQEAMQYSIGASITKLLEMTGYMVAGRTIERFDKELKLNVGKAKHIVNNVAEMVCNELSFKYHQDHKTA